MADSTIYTRAFSRRSSGQLVSGRGSGHGPLSDLQLINEFRKHADKANKKPTALISVSTRIIDTVKRALDEFRMGESPADIWIVFMEIPADDTHETPVRIHPAHELAGRVGFHNPQLFLHEAVIEWAVPKACVLHQISLQTLIERGLLEEAYSPPVRPNSEYFSTEDFRSCVADRLQDNAHDAWGTGCHLAFFAKRFGATAPIDWIAHQLFNDCAPFNMRGIQPDMDDGIDTVLYDWWLVDGRFIQAYDGYKEWESVMEELIIDKQIGFWEKWHIDDDDEWITTLSETDRLAYESEYESEYDAVLNYEEGVRKSIETEALRIGL